MKKLLLILLIVLLASTTHILAIEGLKLNVQGSNAIISWPSRANETYIVQHRATLDTNTVWVTLAGSLAAALNTNRTSFMHTGAVLYPACSGGSGGGTGDPPPSPGGASLAPSSSDSGTPRQDKWIYEGREPYTWEKENRPPFPWDPEMSGRKATSSGLQSSTLSSDSSTQSLEPACQPTLGFYRVVRNGIFFVGITNGSVLSGIADLAIELGYLNGLALDSVTASLGSTADDLPIPAIEISGWDTGALKATWDTTQISNGTYQVYLSASFNESLIVNSEPVSITVSNQIWFPDPFNVAGYFIEVQAQSIHANGSYHIELFDESGFRFVNLNGPVDSQGFITYDGSRGFRVENYNANGVQYADRIYKVVVSTTAPAASGGAAAAGNTAISTNFIWAEHPWPSNTFNNLYTQFAIAYQPVYGDPANGGLNAVAIQSMIQPWYSAADIRTGGLGTVRGSDQNPFELWSQGDYTTLLRDLNNDAVRNLYYFGHGDPELIGQSKIALPKYLTKQELTISLNNFPRNMARNPHPFRFVFLDGCYTAKGDLCKVFGIPKQKNMKAEDFTKKGLRLRAFMGWKKRVIIGWGGSPNNDHLTFMADLLETWPNYNSAAGRPYTLREAINIAEAGYSDAREYLVVYGCDQLWFDDTIP